MSGSITDVAGVRVGHAQDENAKTGCTVILPPETGTMGGISMHGAAPATRETNLLRVDGITREIHAVLLTGGSAFGLDATGGVVRWLERKGIGFNAGVARVPLVPTASLFDLAYGKADVRPDASMGEHACENATNGTVAEGPVGAGCGATVGKLLGMDRCTPSGIGSASTKAKGVTIGAIAVSNAFGDLRNEKGEIVAGAIDPESGGFLDTGEYLQRHGMPSGDPFANCTFAVVAVDMLLDRRMANRLAEMAAVGISRAVNPAHTMFDFDVVFALGCGKGSGDLHAVGCAAAELVQEALIRGALATADK